MTGQIHTQIMKAPKVFSSRDCFETEVGTKKKNKAISIEVDNDLYSFDDLNDLFNFIIILLGENECAFAWELDKFLAPILRKLNDEALTHLWKENKLYLPPYQLFYIPSKVFSVRHVSWPNSRKSFYNLNQYFKKYTEQPKDVQYFSSLLVESLDSIGLRPNKFTSPIKIYEECILKYLNLPRLANIHKEASKFAEQCTGKLWVEAYQIGHWEVAYDYDIESAFPTATKELIDIRNGKWVRDKQYQPFAHYGYLKGKVIIHKNVKVHPIMCKKKSAREKNAWFTPTGTWKTFLTKSEYEFINNYQIGVFEIEDAWWFFPQYISYPLLVPMSKILKWKESEDWIVREFAKSVSVGVYGKFLEKHRDGDVGEYFNPVYGAEICTSPRLFLAEKIYEHELQDSLIHVSVDGFKLNRRIENE